MKHSVVNSPSAAQHKYARILTKGAKIIHCSFCQNTFSAAPRSAVCLKCKRPANRPLALPDKLLCLILFPVGLFKAIWLRSSRPYAASQALVLALAGTLICAAIYFLMTHH